MNSVFIKAALALVQATGSPVPATPPQQPRIEVVNMPRGPNQPAQPQNSPTTWVTSFDYPSRALREELTGTVQVDLIVNRWGLLADCVVTESSGHAILDEETCRLVVRRARFFPATDANSKPVPGKVSMRFAWVLPDAPAPPSAIHYRIATDTYPRGPRLENAEWAVIRPGDYPAEALARNSEGPSLIALDVDAMGKITACSVRLSSGDSSLDRATCSLATQRARFAPGTDLNGRNAGGRVLTGIDWRTTAISERPVSPQRTTLSPAMPFGKAEVSAVAFDANSDGTVSNCRSTGDLLEGVGRSLFRICDIALRYPDFKYQPLVDASANPVDAHVTVKYSVEVVTKPKTSSK